MSKMKDYNKYMKELGKDPNYEILSEGTKNTVKVVHKKSGKLYSVHPGDKAVKPLKSWIIKNK